MSMIKRIAFSLRAAAEVYKATKAIGCDSPLVVVTRDDMQQQIDDINKMIAEKNLLYAVVDHVVAGGSPCDCCRERDECTYSNKGQIAAGCGLWDLPDIVPADREEDAHEPAAAKESAEANP